MDRLAQTGEGARGLLAGLREAGAVFPDLEGGSILNLHTSLLAALAAPEPRALEGLAPPIRDDRTAALLERARRIVVLLIDALGAPALERLAAEGRLPVWERLRSAGHYTTLTSVFPSATNVVLTSFHTGLAPAAHGIPGYRIYLPEVGAVCEMIRFRKLCLEAAGEPAFLPDCGVPLESFAFPTLFERLALAGVPSIVVFRKHLAQSALSELHHRGAVEVLPFIDTGDQMVQLRRAFEKLPQSGGLLYTYWDAIDAIQHHYGASGEEVEAEAAKLLFSLEREFLSRIGPDERRGTLLLLLSDHGQVSVPPENRFIFHDHPDLLQLMELPPAGNSRVTYLRARPGRAAELEAALRERLPQGYDLVHRDELLLSGLLGRGPAHPELAERIGDFVIFAGENRATWYHPERKEPSYGGHHGGLTEEEMRIPLLAVELEKLD